MKIIFMLPLFVLYSCAQKVYKVNYCTVWKAQQTANQDYSEGNFSRKKISEANKCIGNLKYNDKKFIEDYNIYLSDKIKSFCSINNIKKYANNIAEDFNSLETINIKKTCGKDGDHLVKIALKTYSLKIKDLCQTSFWINKAENDARAKINKTIQIDKIKKCSINLRERLSNHYIKAYDQKYNEILQAEAVKRREEIEKRKLDAIISINNTLQSSNSRIKIIIEGKDIFASCRISNNKTIITVANPNEKPRRKIKFRGTWRITFYDKYDHILSVEKERETIRLRPLESETISVFRTPQNSSYCRLNFDAS